MHQHVKCVTGTAPTQWYAHRNARGEKALHLATVHLVNGHRRHQPRALHLRQDVNIVTPESIPKISSADRLVWCHAGIRLLCLRWMGGGMERAVKSSTRCERGSPDVCGVAVTDLMGGSKRMVT